MNITLNIQNDQELRAFIKDAIKGQVLSIAREEFLQIVRDEIQRKIKGTDDSQFYRMFRSAMENACLKILRDDHNVMDWNKTFISPIVSAVVSNTLKGTDWNKLVDQVAKEKIKELIK